MVTSARDEVARLFASGLTVEDLLAGIVGQEQRSGTRRRPDLSVIEFYEDTVIRVAAAANRETPRCGGMFRTYEPYWRLFVYGYPYQRRGIRTSGGRVGSEPVPTDELLYAGCGSKLLGEVTPTDVVEAVGWAEVRARLDAHWRTARREDAGRAVQTFSQRGTRRNAVSALRFLFATAERERLIPVGTNPAADVTKPPKELGNRRAFTEDELLELWGVVISGGDDPELDALLVETVLVTGARRGGLKALSVRDLDVDRATVVLHEKGGRVDEQPATRDLVVRLAAFAEARGSLRPEDPVFNFADAITLGRPHRITDRRFDYLHQRIQEALPWADRLGVTSHWCRHHSITQIERVSSAAVANTFARHANTSVTAIYTKASMAEVCRAVSIVTGTEHPLANGGW